MDSLPELSCLQLFQKLHLSWKRVAVQHQVLVLELHFYVTRVVQPMSPQCDSEMIFSIMATGFLLWHIPTVAAAGGSGACLPQKLCVQEVFSPVIFSHSTELSYVSADRQLRSQHVSASVKYFIPAYCSFEAGKSSEAGGQRLVLSQQCPESRGSCHCT